MKNVGTDGGGWNKRDFYEDTGEDWTEVGWTCGENGGRTSGRESRWPEGGGEKEEGGGVDRDSNGRTA